MPSVADISAFFRDYTPFELAEEWDNVGLLVGDSQREVCRLMTCLTITPASADEAIREGAQLIVTHHPLPFRPLKRITCESPEGRLLWKLIGAGIGIYSPHTAFDSAAEGINQRLAIGLGLTKIAPLRPLGDDSSHEASSPLVGAGRWGILPQTLTIVELAEKLKAQLSIPQLQYVGSPDRVLRNVAIACGSAGEFLPIAAEAGCDALITGETRFHTCLEAESLDVALLLVGHYASERFGVEALADVLAERFAGLTAWASRDESDPLRWA